MGGEWQARVKDLVTAELKRRKRRLQEIGG
jgi:hypothetical protein